MPDARVAVLPSPTGICSICYDIDYRENSAVKSFCIQCRNLYCGKHASKVDPDYCDVCLRTEGVTTTVGDLIDDEGERREGKRITLSGEFWMEIQRDVAEMTDEELEKHVVSLRGAVREIEIIRDYRKIGLAHGENELEVRRSGKLRRLRLIKDVKSGKFSVASITDKKRKREAPPTSPKDILAKLVSMGLSMDQIKAMLAKGGVK